MKKVKFDGIRWWLSTPGDGFFNPYTEVLFSGGDQPKISKIVKAIYPTTEEGLWYEIPDNNIYTALHNNACRWDHKPYCYECESKGVLAVLGTGYGFNLGSTDDGDKEIEAIKKGISSIDIPS